MLELPDIINHCNVYKIVNCSPKYSLSECCHYSRYEMFSIFSEHGMSPDALYRRYTSYTTNSYTLDTKLLVANQLTLKWSSVRPNMNTGIV
jgi:hypothetical protein